MFDRSHIYKIVSDIVRKYWLGYPEHVIENYINRHVFEASLLAQALGNPDGKTVVDIGGGWGTYASTCAALGFKSFIVEDFGDPGKADKNDPRQNLLKEYGVSVIERDVVKEGLDFPENTISAFTSFDMIEHLHASPKKFLHDAVKALHKGGIILVGVPNCVNLRKRISVPFGYGKWSSFDVWYDQPDFRGHVREPDIDDLRRIALDLGLSNPSVFGRNWMGYESNNRLIRAATKLSDKFMRVFPGLCSDIYLMGLKK